MRACVLLMLAMIGQSTATQSDIIQDKANAAPSLNPGLYGREPVHSRKEKMLRVLLTPTDPEEGPSTRFLIGNNGNLAGNLAWVKWNNALPSDAVAIYNGYTKRTDYVCKYQCEAGFYSPSLGPYCRYPYNNHEYRAANFQVLVNNDNFEFLEWKEGSYGSVPQDSVRTCSGVDIFVGKNKYGLGKVVSQHKAFFLPWEGDEYWYKTYQVLSISQETYNQHISHVEYALDDAQLFKNPPENMQTSLITNNECQEVIKMVTMSVTNAVQTTWNMMSSTTLGVMSSITTKIPLLGSVGLQLSVEQTLQFTRGTSVTKTVIHSVTVQMTVPPNFSCSAHMEGRKFTADIPYTARLSRTYRNGETHWTSISGTYDGVQISEVRAVVDRCEPVPDHKPCR